MAKVYVSSTFFDLREFREKATNVLRQMGHEDLSMEYYVAEDRRPLERSLADVAACDLFIGIIAWQYGWIPPEGNPEELSITELEYRRAKNLGKPCLMFLLDGMTPWPLKFVDGSQQVSDFREHVRKRDEVSSF